MGCKSKKTNTRKEKTLLRESLQLAQMVSSNRKNLTRHIPNGAMVSLVVPFLQPGDLGISVSSDVGGGVTPGAPAQSWGSL